VHVNRVLKLSRGPGSSRLDHGQLTSPTGPIEEVRLRLMDGYERGGSLTEATGRIRIHTHDRLPECPFQSTSELAFRRPRGISPTAKRR